MVGSGRELDGLDRVVSSPLHSYKLVVFADLEPIRAEVFAYFSRLGLGPNVEVDLDPNSIDGTAIEKSIVIVSGSNRARIVETLKALSRTGFRPSQVLVMLESDLYSDFEYLRFTGHEVLKFTFERLRTGPKITLPDLVSAAESAAEQQLITLFQRETDLIRSTGTLSLVAELTKLSIEGIVRRVTLAHQISTSLAMTPDFTAKLIRLSYSQDLVDCFDHRENFRRMIESGSHFWPIRAELEIFWSVRKEAEKQTAHHPFSVRLAWLVDDLAKKGASGQVLSEEPSRNLFSLEERVALKEALAQLSAEAKTEVRRVA